MNYAYSASKNAFYSYEWKGEYDAAGTWPADAVDVSDDVWKEFSSEPPAGKVRASDSSGMPVWVDKPAPSNLELRKAALTDLSNKYKEDSYLLNMAWVAAAVKYGTGEASRKDAITTQLNALDAQYKTDRSAIIAQYPI
ncbi:tail fiber assembly protein [Enterobacter asburiae]|uniref:tail fiber assembly protein n=1 Tax=Enterobacter asburiae TaxID=61645 RepID=UPI001866F5C0|nr:tail fiber assembly protein [Enterobacter asburiae]